MVDRVRYQRHMQRRRLGLNFDEFGLYRLEHADIRGALRLEDAERGSRPSIQPGDAANLFDAIVHVRDFTQAERPAATGHDLRICQRRRRFGAPQNTDGLFAAAHLRPAASRIQIERPHLFIDLERRQPQCLQPAGIQFHTNFPTHAAAARYLRNAGNGEQPFGDAIVDGPTELFGRERRSRHRVVRDGISIDIDSLHQRFQDALGQVVAYLRHRVAYIRHRAIDGRADLKFHVDIDGAFDDVGDDVAHIADARDRAFHLLGNLRFHFRRRGARLPDADADQRKGNVRTQVDGQSNERRHAQKEQHHEQHHGRDGMADGPGGNVLHEEPVSFSTGLTTSPCCKNAPAVATTRSLSFTPSAMLTPLPTMPETCTACRSTLFCALTTRT